MRTIAEIVARRGARLATLNAEQQFEWTSPSAFVDDGVKPVFEVTTRLGRRIKVTATHPFLTLGGWKPLAELAVGDAIGVPRQLEVFGDEALGEHRARLLGYLLGDGGLTATRRGSPTPGLRCRRLPRRGRRFGGVRVTAPTAGARPSTLTSSPTRGHGGEARRFAASLASALAGRAPGASLAAATGVSPASITGWRHGRYVPVAPRRDALAAVFPELEVPAAARRNAPNALTRWLPISA